MIIGTAGHIDHGKTLLVKALTGVTTDRLKQEMERGISIELGFAYVPVPESITTERPAGDILGFVDVPGHEKFVHTMVAGAAGIDFALLVVAADDGIMPQTREHLQILDLLGISEGVVALNKVDLVDADRVLAVQEQIRDLLVGTSLEGIDILPVSAIQGTGVANLKQRLLEEAASRPERPIQGTFRLAIDRCFTLHGAGTVVTGAVRSGRIKVGDKVLVLPLGDKVRVRTLHVQGRESEVAHAGQRCALNLVGIEKSALGRGDWLVEPETATMTACFDAEVKLLKTEARAVRNCTPIHLHVGTTRVPARVFLLEGDKLLPGERALVQVVADRPLPLVFGDLFVMRDVSAGRTMGGGRVIDPQAPRRRRRSVARRAVRGALSTPESAEALDGLLSLPPGFVDLSDFVAGRGLSTPEVEEIVALLEPETFMVSGKRFAAHTEVIQALGDTMAKELAEFHARHPDLPGMPRSTLRKSLEQRLTTPIFDAAVAVLVRKEVLVAAAGTVRLPSHSSSIRSADMALWARISAVMEARRNQPPPLQELADSLNQSITPVRKVCKTMVQLGALVEVRKDRFFLKGALRDLGDLAHEIATTSPSESFTVAEFRDRARCGRAVAVQVLEYFDRRGITGRRGDVRIVAKAPSDVFGDANAI